MGPVDFQLFPEELTRTIRAGLRALGIERLTLAIHDASFPSDRDEDVGRGTPYGKGGRALLGFAAGLGFDSVQLGPQGDVSATNPSPYDGALFTKNPLSLALATLAEDPLWSPLCAGLLAPLVEQRPVGLDTCVQHEHAWLAARRTLATLHDRFRAGATTTGAELERRFADFRARWGATLAADGLYEALTVEHGSDDWRRWGSDDACLFFPSSTIEAGLAAGRAAALATSRAAEIERHLFGQFALDQQHRVFRTVASAASLSLFGDLQIGFSHRDVWSRRGLFRDDYLMGAPPSRTNPAGQPWGYPVLDVDRAPEPALALLAARVDRMVAEFDGLRIDHPALAAVAIPTSEQLSSDPGLVRYADDWVQALRDDQVARYGLLFDAVMTRVRAAGRKESDVVCEVLSTWPYPLRRVMARYGLGRFCVTQKADLARADDVYRSENASPRDWIMVGNHDTPPIWLLAEAWHGTAAGAERARALSLRLSPLPELQARLERWLQSDARHLCHGMFAELFVGPARRISVFFADLFGLSAIYNRPGVVHPDNWTLRLPAAFAESYARHSAAGATFNVPLALALALAGRPDLRGIDDRSALVRRLIAGARQLSPALDPEIWAWMETALAVS